MNRSRIASVAFALLLVTAAVAGPATQQAAAWEMGTKGECDGLDYMMTVATSGVLGTQLLSEDCALRFGEDSDLSSHLDHYQQGESWKSQNDAFYQSYENFGQDTRSLAFSKAKITIVNGLNDGNTSSVVKGQANTTVRDYYAKQQREILMQVDRYHRSAEYSDNASDSFVISDQSDRPLVGWTDVEYKLQNGSTVWVRMPIFDKGGEHWVSRPAALSTDATRNATTSIYGVDQTGSRHVTYSAPSSDYSQVIPSNVGRVDNLLSDMASQSQQVTANVDTYVDGVYSKYQQGEINTTDIADPQTLASQAATDYDSTGYYSYAAMNLAGLGYSGNLNASMHVTTANNSYNGTLFYTADDVGSFTAGETYNVSNLNGTAYMAAQTDSGGTVVALKEDFTVQSLTNTKTGSSMNSTQVESYTYESTNTSKLSEEIQRLSQLREEYENMESSGGGSGSGSGSGTSSNLLLVLLAGAAGAAILIGQRDNGGGRRGGR